MIRASDAKLMLKTMNTQPTISVNRGIQSFYERIHRRYDRVNSWITFGMDALWRRRLIGECLRLLEPNSTVLDLCTGTGKIAGGLATQSRGKALRIVGADFSIDMLLEGKKATFNRSSLNMAVGADARFLPFPDNSFDAVTISFATRNLDARPGDFNAVMAEMDRLLKPGGFWLQLETAQPGNGIIRWLFHRFVGLWVPLISRLMGEDEASYRFLSNSIRSFDSPEGLTARMEAFGFTPANRRSFLFGAACLIGMRKKNG